MAQATTTAVDLWRNEEVWAAVRARLATAAAVGAQVGLVILVAIAPPFLAATTEPEEAADSQGMTALAATLATADSDGQNVPGAVT